MTLAAPDAQQLIPGAAAGPLLFADVGLSFWGGIDPATGVVIDRHHPLIGAAVSGCVVAIPSGRGSCTGSAVLIELIARGIAPAALIFCEPETILPLGALVAEAVFGRSIPMARLGRGAFAALAGATCVRLSDGLLEVLTNDGETTRHVLAPVPVADIPLTARDVAMRDGGEGPARQIAMGIVLAAAALEGARALIDVTQAHLDCCVFTGPASVAVVERFRDLGGRFHVPATLNAISIDFERWAHLGGDPSLVAPVERQVAAFRELGARLSFTCAPYLLEGAPTFGQQVAWGESNAVAFANSVLGARTLKYPDYLDLCVALTGRAPASGCHLEEPREPRLRIEVTVPEGADE